MSANGLPKYSQPLLSKIEISSHSQFYSTNNGNSCAPNQEEALMCSSSDDKNSLSSAKSPGSKEVQMRRIVHKEDQSYPAMARMVGFTTLLCLAITSFWNQIFQRKHKSEKNREGYVALFTWKDTFFTNHVIRRGWSGLSSPIASPPGNLVTVIDRESPDNGWTISMTSRTRECINLGSYNYLNIAEKDSPCIDAALEAMKTFGVGNSAQGRLFGTTRVHLELEKNLAEFIGVEAALTFGMGFATNSLNIPALLNSETLVLSDEFNHASIIVGLRLSGAKIRIFKHNDMVNLESQIRHCIIAGNAGNPWKKIVVVVEGIYSMHGSIAKLPQLVELKVKYDIILYVDEAHSMGALGKHGKGITEYFNINPRRVDVLMGTFAKSFGAVGGYIAGSQELINALNQRSIAHHYGTIMSPVIAAFLVEGIKLLKSTEGETRIESLSRNTRYFRKRMLRMGYHVCGDDDSPVVPVRVPVSSLVYIVDFMREKNVAAVLVSYPVTPFNEGRIRCCMNALHTKEMLDHVLKCFEQLLVDLAILPRTAVLRSKDEVNY